MERFEIQAVITSRVKSIQAEHNKIRLLAYYSVLPSMGKKAMAITEFMPFEWDKEQRPRRKTRKLKEGELEAFVKDV